MIHVEIGSGHSKIKGMELKMRESLQQTEFLASFPFQSLVFYVKMRHCLVSFFIFTKFGSQGTRGEC